MVEVIQADREAAASVAVLVEMRELIRAGRADHHAEPFAAHRLSAIAEKDAEITRLREVIEAWRDIDRKRDAEVERLREALRNIVNYDTSEFPERGEDICEHYYPLKEIASAAIKEPSHDEG